MILNLVLGIFFKSGPYQAAGGLPSSDWRGWSDTERMYAPRPNEPNLTTPATRCTKRMPACLPQVLTVLAKPCESWSMKPPALSVPAIAFATHGRFHLVALEGTLKLMAAMLAAADALLFVKRQFETVRFLWRAVGSGQIPPEQCSVLDNGSPPALSDRDWRRTL